MTQERQPGEKGSGRTRTEDEDRHKGNPAQTGPGTGGGMGTDEGSGFAPPGERFGPKSTEGEKKGESRERSR